MKYVPISFKSDYSLLKSLYKVKDIIDFATSRGSSYAGILDENPYAIMDFYEKCEANKLKCIFGQIVKIGSNKIYLYIKDIEGYHNLIKINDLVNDNKLTFNDLIKYNGGLLCVLPYDSYNIYNRLKSHYQVWLGYINNFELEKASQINKNTLFINEVACEKKEDEKYLSLLAKIGGEEYTESTDYILEASEEDIESIQKFIENIDFHMEFGNLYIPKTTGPDKDSLSVLRSLTKEGLKRRLNGVLTRTYVDRLKYELRIIESMGFVDYFLIVFDYVKYAKKCGIHVSTRGSAAGSLVSYTLGITDIDPIKYDLLFERFLNPERVTMPDIDVDFEDTRRGEVIDYVRKKYGEGKVSLIVAYGTLAPRAVLRDAGKALGIDQVNIDTLCKRIDAKKSLKENLQDKALVDFIKSKSLEKLYKIGMRLEGLKKHTTIHAAGVVISSIPLLEIIPTYKTSDGLLAGFTMEYLEKLGLLKMDFLAVRNLTTIHNTVDVIQEKHPDFDLKNIPLDDKKTYELLSSGNTDNIFQFETPGMKKFLKKLKPNCFDDLIAAVALFRPGPMDNIDEYIRRRNNKNSIHYPHPDLELILKSTYGIMIYQEQIMQILSLMGGYSFGEADIIRRAMSKKKKDVMIKERERFISGAMKKGYLEKTASEVYDLIVKFANYGFNKSHSVAYAILGYQMAYMKANYTDLYHVNTLNMNIGSDAKIKDVIEDAKNKGLMILKPDVNKSSLEYTIDNGSIILPLTSIKGISSAHSKTIHDNMPYSDLFDFVRKTNNRGITRPILETLIKAGALNSFGVSINTLLLNIDSAYTYTELVNSLDESLIMKPVLEISNEPLEDYSEIDIFGFYISGHPASGYSGNGIVKIKDFGSHIDKYVDIVVLIDKIKVIETKAKEKMAFVDIEDDTKTCGAVIFPKNNSITDKLNIGELVRLRGQINKRNDELQFVIQNLLPLDKK